MQARETNVHSFMVRLWQEEAKTDTTLDRWRGHITHIPSNQRRYIEDLDAIKHFIEPYLGAGQADTNPKPNPPEPKI